MAATQKQKGNIANLKPFKKGQSGNPGGRPKGSTSLVSLLKRLGAEPSDTDKNLTRDEAMMREIYKAAETVDKQAIQFITERREGKPRQAIDLTERDPDEVVEIG